MQEKNDAHEYAGSSTPAMNSTHEKNILSD